MRVHTLRPSLTTSSPPSQLAAFPCDRRSAATAIAMSLLLLATAAHAANDKQISPREALTESERAELISAAVNASAGREATANERQLLNMTRDEARAMMSKQRVQEKSLNASPIRVIKRGDKGVAVVGTALSSSSVITLSHDGKHLHTCGPEEHVHDEATVKKLEASARVMNALKGGARE